MDSEQGLSDEMRHQRGKDARRSMLNAIHAKMLGNDGQAVVQLSGLTMTEIDVFLEYLEQMTTVVYDARSRAIARENRIATNGH